MAPRTRDQILADWAAVIRGPGLGLTASAEAVLSNDEAVFILNASYQHRTYEVREWTGVVAYWEAMPQDERDKAAKSGAAMPDGSYPITTCDGDNSVDTAINAVGRGGADHDAIRAHIMKRADSLGCASKIPDNWNADGSLKDAAAAAAGDGTAFAPPPPPPPHAGNEPPPAPDSTGTKAPPKPPAPPAAGDKPDGAEAADAGISAKIDSALQAVSDAVAAQQKDPDNATDPKDAKVLADLQHAEAALKQAQTDQGADADETAGTSAKPAPETGAKPPAPDGAAPPTDGTPPAAGVQAAGGDVPGNAEGIPGDGDDSPPSVGDIEAGVKCENPNCQHVSDVHEDTADGMNSGHCQTPGCECPGMVVTGTQVVGPDETTGGPNNAGGDDEAGGTRVTGPQGMTAAGPPPAGGPDNAGGGDAAQAPPVEGAPAPELPPLDALPDVVGAPFTIPVAWLENTPTGDGRMIETGALTWRTPPIPLMGMKTSPHDPSGMSPNDPAVLIGRIETVVRDGSTGVMTGHLLSTDDGAEFAQILDQMGRMGVSIDVGSAEVTVTADPSMPPAADVFDIPLMEMLTKGEIMGATVCPFAAFAGAYIVLGDDPSVSAKAELTPAPADAHMAIRYVDAEVCEPCETSGSLVAASGPTTAAGGPIAPPRAWFDNPAFGLGADGAPIEDDRLRETIDSKTGRPSGKFACPITVTDDGRVFGHIAQWGVCHQSPKFINAGECVLAPRSHTDYALFHRGHVLTAEGELLAIGALTADAGHAGEEWTVERALAHYDNSAMTAAVVRAGEDEYGIWVAGSVHPAASPEQVFTLRSNPPSGDWRPFGVGNELRGVLAVNVPGFPLVQATKRNGKLTSLVAAGVPMFDLPEVAPVVLTIEERMAQVERGFTVLGPLAKAELSRRYAAVRGG